MLIVFVMGFSSGLPLLLIGGTLKLWMTREGVDLTTIGFFSLVGLPYTLKFIWAPFLDRFVPTSLGRRRSWLLITQFALMAGLLWLSQISPSLETGTLAAAAFVIAFFGATQDVAVDAYRREILSNLELGLGSSYSITGYRVAMWFSGGLALILADFMSWTTVYMIMAAMMFVGILTTLLAPEPQTKSSPPVSIGEAFAGPFKEYFQRPGAIWILAFILLYKVGDAMAAEMTMPFYGKLGFSNTEIGTVVKTFGIWAVIAGGFIGGVTMLRLGMRRSLWVFGILQAVSTLCFAWLAQIGPQIPALAVVVSFENLTSGMGTAAYAAFMASLANKRFTATQYALLSSLMGVPRVFLGAPTGAMAEHLGWSSFFVICTLAAIPGLLLLLKISKWSDPVGDDDETNDDVTIPSQTKSAV